MTIIINNDNEVQDNRNLFNCDNHYNDANDHQNNDKIER